jgi:hypothetical protein
LYPLIRPEVNGHFEKRREIEMTRMQVALSGALAAGFLALTTPAFAQIVQGADGHYYKLVPLRHARRLAEARAEAPAPVQAQAQAPNAWGCHLAHFLDNEYMPEYTTVCGLNDADAAMLAQ